MATVKIHMVARVTYEHEWKTSDADAADLIRLAKSGCWKKIAELVDDADHATDSEIDTDSVNLVVNGKQAYQD